MNGTISSPADAKCLSEWEAWIAIAGNILLFLYKIWVALLTGSAAVAADSYHTLSDSMSSIVLLIGVRISARPPDREHPYGHGRAELVSSIIIGIMLAGIAIEFFCEGIRRLWDGRGAEYGQAAVIAMAVTILVKEAMAQFAYWAFRKTGMLSLKADGHHHRSDALSSIVVLFGILVGGRFWWTDGVMTLIVSGMIVPAAWSVLKDAVDQVLGREPDDAFIHELKKLCGPACSVHHVHLHTYGAHKEVTFHILLEDSMNLLDAHEKTTGLEQAVLQKLGCRATIHVEPFSSKKKKKDKDITSRKGLSECRSKSQPETGK